MNVLTVPTTRRISRTIPDNPLSSAIWLPVAGKNLSLEERTILLLIRDLLRLGWRLKSNSRNAFEFVPPEIYGKDVIRQAMAYSRNSTLDRNADWIKKNLKLAHANLAVGSEVLKSEVLPSVEICETQKQKDLFRILRYYWSSQASEYVGRRIRLIIRDKGIKGNPVIGIAAIGSSIIYLPDRDKWIGWDDKTRIERIIYMMDAYVIGAMPPYNNLLGGKLISYILASNEIRALYKKKYRNIETSKNKIKASDLVLIVTSSLYGSNCSQYNRLYYGKSLLFKPIGQTKGYGSLHISTETFNAMRELVEVNGYNTSNKFGMGPNWRMRTIKNGCKILRLNSDTILKHSLRRGLFAVPLAINCKSFLRGESETPKYRDLSMSSLVAYWRRRWLNMRRKNESVLREVERFEPSSFKIEKTHISDLEI